MEVTARDIAKIPARNLRVPRGEFVAVWVAAERHLAEHPTDWYGAGIAVTCRWLANATVRPATGPWRKEPSPVTNRDGSAYEERIEAECLAAEKLLIRRPIPNWMLNQPGWVEAILATLNWAWRHSAGPPIDIGETAAG